MTLKGEKAEKSIIPVIGVSVDDWLDQRRKLDGAEGLWRIHDKLYDFTMWSRIHPGGKFWLDISRGTDITEAFESHHFSIKAESRLQNYYIREAVTPRNFFTSFRDNGFYKAFKRKLRQKEVATLNQPSFALTFTNDCLAVVVFLTALLAVKYGTPWVIISGVLIGVLSVSSHRFLHKNDNWRIYYFNLSLMLSRDWRIRHVLSHHQYRNTNSDLEIAIWRPFSRNHEGLTKYVQPWLNLLLFPVAVHIQFIRRFLDVFLSKKLGFHGEEVIAFSLPLFMFIFGKMHLWDVFVTWNLVLFVGSFVFSLTGSNFLRSEGEVKLGKNTGREEEDFGKVQLSHIDSHPKDNESVISFLNSYRGNILHYLCPTFHCESLGNLISVFEETVDEFGLAYSNSPKRFGEELSNRLPRGHLFFS